MTPPQVPGMSQRLVFGLAITLGLLLAGTSAAQDLAKHAESLKFVPADVAAYSVMLRNGEQIDAVLKSKAWAKLNALPLVKMAWQALGQQLKQTGSPLAAFQQWYQQPENKQLVELLKEMGRDEIFIATGHNVTQLGNLAGDLYGASQMAPLYALFRGQNPDPRMQLKMVLQTLNEEADNIVIPEITIGFRLKDPATAKAQLSRLETLAKMVAAAEPLLRGRVEKKQLGATQALVLRLDGSMIPWDKLPVGEFEDNPGDYDKLIKKLKGLKATVSLGLRENFLILSLAGSTAAVESLGRGQALGERSELQRLARFADRKIIEISYTSKAIEAIRGAENEDMAKSFLNYLKKAGLTAEQEAKVRKQLKQLSKDLKRVLPEPGAQASIGFLTDQGAESYTFDWTKNTGRDSRKPLTLLHHVGKAPLFAAAARHKYDPADYKLLVKWIKIAHSCFEEYSLPMLNEQVQDIYKQVMTNFGPLFARIDKTTGEMLLPALADGQFAFVLDAKLTSKQWHFLMPASEKPLALPEPAFVFGVKDAGLLVKAMEEYRDIGNKAFEALGQIVPIPFELKIPEPDSTKIKEGTLYSYSFPDLLMLDPRIKPTAGLSDKVAVLTISHEHATRLLKRSTLKTPGSLLSDAKKPFASAMHFDFEGLVRAAGPWIELVLQTTGAAGDGQDSPLEQVRTALEILTVLRGYTGISYIEDGALVTHGQTIIRDLP